jgi:hypothetical protein
MPRDATHSTVSSPFATAVEVRAFEAGRLAEPTCAHRLAELDRVADEIVVESRACIQPYFVVPTVRPRTGSRRRTGIEPA